MYFLTLNPKSGYFTVYKSHVSTTEESPSAIGLPFPSVSYEFSSCLYHGTNNCSSCDRPACFDFISEVKSNFKNRKVSLEQPVYPVSLCSEGNPGSPWLQKSLAKLYTQDSKQPFMLHALLLQHR